MACRKGAVLRAPCLHVGIHSEEGHLGECANWAPKGARDTAVTSAKMALGRDWAAREGIWRNARRASRPGNPCGLSFVGNALWDLAGRAWGASLSAMLGGWRREVRAYASCSNGDRSGNLSSNEAVAEFFLGLQALGFTGSSSLLQ
ncbi:hypothetical protein [Poseidonocella sp. HB161398]|uniref:hypothetical protein n=1 Tax=Poseidonocella sp. HB161398 TaxID=2320855 RepID=UPI0011086F9F|nr:hypothetical protein [Poseidonocella sp. HB161398]